MFPHTSEAIKIKGVQPHEIFILEDDGGGRHKGSLIMVDLLGVSSMGKASPSLWNENFDAKIYGTTFQL